MATHKPQVSKGLERAVFYSPNCGV